VIGYGARPKECIDFARKFKWTTRGNHEQAMLNPSEGEGFSDRAADAIEWTRKVLSDPKDPANANRLTWLGSLEEQVLEGDVIYCHGSPRLPVSEYVRPDLGKLHPDRLKLIFEKVPHVAFVAHTHWPGVYTEDLVFHSTTDLGNEFAVAAGKAIINVGSVGQPRDRNSRACYVVFDGSTVVFRRVAYDIDREASRIYAVGELDDKLADRLYEGK
jgi:diadenosine tetraphosphatase ApaH/serine/threonine PP2A family protein phosphatase